MIFNHIFTCLLIVQLTLIRHEYSKYRHLNHFTIFLKKHVDGPQLIYRVFGDAEGAIEEPSPGSLESVELVVSGKNEMPSLLFALSIHHFYVTTVEISPPKRLEPLRVDL